MRLLALAPAALLAGSAAAGLLPVGRIAPPKEVAGIAREFALPPVRPGEEPFRAETHPFPAAVLKRYAADVTVEEMKRVPATYPLRAGVLKAFVTVREVWAPPPAQPAPKAKKKVERPERPVAFRTELPGPLTEPLKRAVRDQQERPAVGIVRLEEALAELEALAPHRVREVRRWQAHYDYAAAQVLARLAFLHEYNLALGQVLRDDLPKLDPAKHAGWRLAPAAKMHSRKDVQELAERSRERFETVAADHPDTPWAVLARRELAAPPGLKWEPRAK